MAARTHTLRRAAAGAERARQKATIFRWVLEAAAAGPGAALEVVSSGGAFDEWSLLLQSVFWFVCRLSLSVLGPESPAAVAAMTCDESSKQAV